MSKQRYIDKKFAPESWRIIEIADDILREYTEQRLVVTVRQLYYQFVARDLLPNTQKNYKRLADIVSEARMAGHLDWDAIEDRGRVPATPSEWESIEDIVNVAMQQFRLPRLLRQKVYPELWVEKQALAGVLEPVARQHHVTLMVNKGYCVDPQVKVLTADLRWVQAGDVTEGTSLIGVDESVPGDKQHRRMRTSVVEGCHRFVSPRVRVNTDRGSIVVSDNHPFLAVKYTNPKIHGYSWVEAERLMPGCRIAFLAPPWTEESSYEAGWLAGIYDGEGCLPRTMRGRTLSVYQKPGAVADRIRRMLAERGWLSRENTHRPSGVIAFHTTGVERILAALGSLRPLRLLNDFARHVQEGWYPAKGKYPATVLSVEVLPPGEVIGLETSSKTLITDGFVSHNSSASAMRESAMRFRRNMGTMEEASGTRPDALLLYLGDHDPSGEDMVRDIEKRLTLFGVEDLEVKKVALTMEQIKQHKPPPNPAKSTDPRFKGYQELHGDESWELDALEPSLLQRLVQNDLRRALSPSIAKAVVDEENRQRNEMSAAIDAARARIGASNQGGEAADDEGDSDDE